MPTEFVGKDANCDQRINILDALRIMYSTAGLTSISSETPCVPAAQGGSAPGDADCRGLVEVMDSLDVLRNVAGLPQTAGNC